MSRPERCPNCGQLPKFVESNDRYYRFLLVHGDGQGFPNVSVCSNPGKYGMVIYHHSREECIQVWNKRVMEIRNG